MPMSLVFGPATAPAAPPDAATVTPLGVSAVPGFPADVYVEWDVSPGATGQVAYGPTAALGSLTLKEPQFLAYHRQRISGLTEGATYSYSILWETADGAAGATPVATFTVAGTPPPDPDPDPDPEPEPQYGSLYGIWNPMNGVGNLRLWLEPTIASFRFRAKRTGYIRSVRWSNTTGAGYSSGDPQARISLQADDGSSLHRPTGTILSQCPTFLPAKSDNAGTLSTFSTPYQVTAGQLYHVVFETLGPGSGDTWSINCIVMQNGQASPRWGSGALDMGALFFNNGSWSTQGGIAMHPGYYPIMELAYSDTAGGAIVDRQGQGFVSLSDPVYQITGDTQVRERIVVSGGDRTVVGVIVFCERVQGTGTSPLIASLESTPGTPLATATFPATDFVTGDGIRNHDPTPRPAERLFTVARTLSDGGTYYLRLSTDAGTTYMTEAATKGSGWGYDPSLCFGDGAFQRGTGGATGSFSTISSIDVQMMLRLGS